MKVIKKGTKPKEVRAVCRACKSTILTREDRLRWEYDRDGRLARAKCPECKAEIFFY